MATILYMQNSKLKFAWAMIGGHEWEVSLVILNLLDKMLELEITCYVSQMKLELKLTS